MYSLTFSSKSENNAILGAFRGYSHFEIIWCFHDTKNEFATQTTGFLRFSPKKTLVEYDDATIKFFLISKSFTQTAGHDGFSRMWTHQTHFFLPQCFDSWVPRLHIFSVEIFWLVRGHHSETFFGWIRQNCTHFDDYEHHETIPLVTTTAYSTKRLHSFQLLHTARQN